MISKSYRLSFLTLIPIYYSEIKNEMINAVSSSHIEWLVDALAHIDHANKDLIVSLARLFHVISEYLLKSSNSTLSNLLLDFYLTKNFFLNCMDNLSKSIEASTGGTNEEALTNLNPRLYIIGMKAFFLNIYN